ncbi:hypothetical protein D0Z07_8144 [Hyphodiscus hymeniophilus]|uniref:Uncharacterized protein n=1 Tax=Hyphodiscus hymeniophilus TaxID=353542 RepID=A0A9P6VE92_9HELO|nr:hypothetical protein D0Z07_8144 [Hyphodiscus hymeniophilus]
MSKSSPPEPNLRQWPPFYYIPIYILIVLVTTHIAAFLLAYAVLGPGILRQPIEVAISPPAIILFIAILIPFIPMLFRAFWPSNTPVSIGQETAEWHVCIESALQAFALEMSMRLDTEHPKNIDAIVQVSKMEFVRYLANPYDGGPLRWGFFSRRRHMLKMMTVLVCGLYFANEPFRDTFADVFGPLFGCLLAVFCCHTFGPLLWEIEWTMKLGGIARQIRRECIKNGRVKGSEEDVEKFAFAVDPEEMLQWWIQETCRACGDGHDILQSELSQLDGDW